MTRDAADTILAAGAILGLVLVVLGIVLIASGPQTTKETQYNCELSEISPDYPIKVKALCRELKR